MQKRFNYIEYEVDLLSNDVDKLETNKTMEAIESLQDKIVETDLFTKTRVKHYDLELERMTKQIDLFISNSISFDEQLKMRMVNIENAYRLFNITNDFQFSDIQERIRKLAKDHERYNEAISDYKVNLIL